MALFDKRNIDKAMALAEKNKGKIADTVNKATDAIDKKTGGKHTDKLKKVDDAAKKFAGEAPAGADQPATTEAASEPASDEATTDEAASTPASTTND